LKKPDLDEGELNAEMEGINSFANEFYDREMERYEKGKTNNILFYCR
jgi:hypothetical protein